MDWMVYFLFLLIPLASLGLLFMPDSNKRRKKIWNIAIVIHTILFFCPILFAWLATPSGENMWNENTGGGAILWIYLILLPVCLVILTILVVLKIRFAISSRS